MKSKNVTRRAFLTTVSAGTLAAATAGGSGSRFTPFLGTSRETADKLALLGGKPIRGIRNGRDGRNGMLKSSIPK